MIKNKQNWGGYPPHPRYVLRDSARCKHSKPAFSLHQGCHQYIGEIQNERLGKHIDAEGSGYETAMGHSMLHAGVSVGGVMKLEKFKIHKLQKNR